MQTKSSIGASVRALTVGLLMSGAMIMASPASAALTSGDQAAAGSLAAQIDATVKATVAADAGKTPAEIRKDVEAAIEAAILSSGDTLEVASAALGQAEMALNGTPTGSTDGVPQAFKAVADALNSGTLPGAGNGRGNGNGNGGNRSNGNGNSAFGTGGGNGGGGGGSGYRGG